MKADIEEAIRRLETDMQVVIRPKPMVDDQRFLIAELRKLQELTNATMEDYPGWLTIEQRATIQSECPEDEMLIHELLTHARIADRRIEVLEHFREPVSGSWRVGGKVPLNVYENNKPMFQCHTPEDAERIVRLLNESERLRGVLEQYRAYVLALRQVVYGGNPTIQRAAMLRLDDLGSAVEIAERALRQGEAGK